MRIKFLLESLKARDHWEDVGVCGRIIFKRILGKYGLGMWIGFIWLRIGTSGGDLVNTLLKHRVP
jgi:hypothetical protein